MAGKKTSVQKKEIIEMGAGGVIFGALAGGPVGGLLAAAATIGAAHMQEQKDEEMRRKNWEATHEDPIKKQERIRESEKEIKRQSEVYHGYIDQITEIMRTNKPYTNVRNMVNFEYDYNKNRFINGKPLIDVTEAPYVDVEICEERRVGGMILQGKVIKTGKGRVYDFKDFVKMFRADNELNSIEKYYINPNIRCKKGYCSYMYTVDGTNYVICLCDRSKL